jgi:hypothetical protein
MKASKFFKLKAEWEKAKQAEQPDLQTITPVTEEVKPEEIVSAPKSTKKKTSNV